MVWTIIDLLKEMYSNAAIDLLPFTFFETMSLIYLTYFIFEFLWSITPLSID